MKAKRLAIVGALAALVIAYAVSIIPNFRARAERNQTVAALKNLPYDRVEAAVQAFVRDRKPTNEFVRLSELVSAGYLRSGDIHGLADRTVSVSLAAADETTPQAVRVRVRGSGRQDTVVFGDGSIQQVLRK